MHILLSGITVFAGEPSFITRYQRAWTGYFMPVKSTVSQAGDVGIFGATNPRPYAIPLGAHHYIDSGLLVIHLLILSLGMTALLLSQSKPGRRKRLYLTIAAIAFVDIILVIICQTLLSA